MEEQKIRYRYNIVDIHSHFLPGVDDGAGNMQESLALLRAAQEEGIRDVIATPHYGIENGYEPEAKIVQKVFNNVVKKNANKGADGERLGVRLYLGEEVYCAEDAAARFKSKKALTINDTGYALVEFLEYGSYIESADIILQRLKQLKESHVVKPILAHAERYRALQNNYDYLRRIQDLGVLIQVNAYDLSLSQNRQTRETAQWLAQERMISFIGSDMHGFPPKRPPKVREGVDWLYAHTDQEYADCVVRKNAEKMLGIEKYAT